jgi:hypothetical protein
MTRTRAFGALSRATGTRTVCVRKCGVAGAGLAEAIIGVNARASAMVAFKFIKQPFLYNYLTHQTILWIQLSSDLPGASPHIS